MSSIQITSSHQAICNCGKPYGDATEYEMEAVAFIREFPQCAECEAADG